MKNVKKKTKDVITSIPNAKQYLIDNWEKCIKYIIPIIVTILAIFTDQVAGICIGLAALWFAFSVYLNIKDKIHNRKLSLIDIERIGKDTDEFTSISTLLEEYIEDCFNRDVLFFKPIRKDDYITSEEETQMLQTLLDSVASNLSSEMRTILGLYVGEDNLHIILGRKSMAIVSLFVAQHNKNIYQNKSTKTTVEL